MKLMFSIILAAGIAAQPAATSAHDERLYMLAQTDMKTFAEEVTKGSASDVERTRAIVHWVIGHIGYEPTDYQTRTVAQIVERRGGNCDDMARVALAAMKELNIRTRRVHDVHIRTISAQRGDNARALVKKNGNQYSVFGTHHNDHVWLEVYDPSAKEWFPADPWTGLVGLDEWMAGRVGFSKRSGPSPDIADMIVPFAIFAADADGNFTINRTQHYLVDEFDREHHNKLHDLPPWKQWTALLGQLAGKAEGAFAGTTNLHDSAPQIDQLAATYEQLRSAYLKSLTPPSRNE